MVDLPLISYAPLGALCVGLAVNLTAAFRHGHPPEGWLLERPPAGSPAGADRRRLPILLDLDATISGFAD
jgi:hypothetical protein